MAMFEETVFWSVMQAEPSYAEVVKTVALVIFLFPDFWSQTTASPSAFMAMFTETGKWWDVHS